MSMQQEVFWNLIGVLGGRPDDQGLRHLEGLLSERSPSEITNFAEHLNSAVSQLDTAAHREFADVGHGDAFLYVRCAVVAAGRQWFARVVAEPPLIQLFKNAELELLLDVAPNAYESSTRMAWEPPLPERNGADPTQIDNEDAGPLWFVAGLNVEKSNLITAEYELTFDVLFRQIYTCRRWASWWAGSGTDILEAFLTFDTKMPESTDIKRGRKLIRMNLVRSKSGFACSSEITESEKARDDLQTLLLMAAEFGHLPEHPQLPPTPKSI